MRGPTADDVARRIVEDGVAPDCAAGWAIRSGGWRRELGGAVDVRFDLASVTKPMTAVAIACAGLDPELPLGHYLAEARDTPSEGVPLELFLAHRAGLAPHLPLYAPLVRGERVDVPAALREAAHARREDARGDPPRGGFPPVYSDLGYVLAGEALARATGEADAGQAIARLVLGPLGLTNEAGSIRELAAREIGGPFAPTETVAWRGGVIHGAVHDENAWALTGKGSSGHAGIFATVGAVLAFGSAVLDSLDGCRHAFGRTVDLSWLVCERPGGTLRAGFDAKSPQNSSAGDAIGARAFGHLGFTGTSLWIDPDAKVVAALLTNRVCPTRDNSLIVAARPRAHSALYSRAVFLRSP